MVETINLSLWCLTVPQSHGNINTYYLDPTGNFDTSSPHHPVTPTPQTYVMVFRKYVTPDSQFHTHLLSRLKQKSRCSSPCQGTAQVLLNTWNMSNKLSIPMLFTYIGVRPLSICSYVVLTPLAVAVSMPQEKHSMQEC